MDDQGLALRGLLVRHLVMPGILEDTREILRWLAGEVSPDSMVGIICSPDSPQRPDTIKALPIRADDIGRGRDLCWVLFQALPNLRVSCQLVRIGC